MAHTHGNALSKHAPHLSRAEQTRENSIHRSGGRSHESIHRLARANEACWPEEFEERNCPRQRSKKIRKKKVRASKNPFPKSPSTRASCKMDRAIGFFVGGDP